MTFENNLLNLRLPTVLFGINRDKRWVQLKDKSVGKTTSWLWDFGDGSSSMCMTLRTSRYGKAVEWAIILTVERPEGKSVLSKVWDVVTK